MIKRIIISPETMELGKNDHLIFLAGPIRGCTDWQSEATSVIINNGDAHIKIANPRRTDWTDVDHFLQMDWETEYLPIAASTGAIIFWLKNQDDMSITTYSRTTRYELGEWVTKKKFFPHKYNVVIGIDPGFPGGEYITHRIKKDDIDIPIFDNLEDTCKCAVNICYRLDLNN